MKLRRKRMCVFCGSATQVNQRYLAAARRMGRLLAEEGCRMIFGGGTIGLMGEVARGVHEVQGHVIGVIPKFIHQLGVTYLLADELHISADMRTRKSIMEHKADGFLVLPGGLGTLEEFLEIATLKQLGRHRKPIVVLNTDGFYDGLLLLFRKLLRLRFMKQSDLKLFNIVRTPEAAIKALKTYRPRRVETKI